MEYIQGRLALVIGEQFWVLTLDLFIHLQDGFREHPHYFVSLSFNHINIQIG